MDDLLADLNLDERHAVALLRTALDFYNSADGTGLFAGVSRYAVLEGRVQLAAVQARTLREFWAVLCRKMLWPILPRAADETILPLLAYPAGRSVLHLLAGQTAPLLMLARYTHTEAKTERRVARTEIPQDPAQPGLTFRDLEGVGVV